MTIAAKVSTASPFPDGERPERADVVLLNAEDDIGDTIRPRLEAAGADLARCWVLPDVHPEGHPPRPPELPADLFLLEDLVKSKAAALIVIDPLMAFLSGQVDSHRDRGRLAAALRGPGAGGPPAHPRHRRPATARGGHRMNRVQYPATLQLRGDGDGRTIEGPLLPWGVETHVLDRNRLVIETFQRGALADADPARVPLTAPPATPARCPSVSPCRSRTAPTPPGAPGTSQTPPSATKSWPWPAMASRPGCRSGSGKCPAVAAGRPTGAASPGPGPSLTTSPWSAYPPTSGPAWSASAPSPRPSTRYLAWPS